MKKLLEIVVLGLLLITSLQADDISDFEIEGISIGDTLLDYYSEKEILENSIADYNSKKFIRFIPYNTSLNLKEFDTINFHYKKNSGYKVYEISGGVVFYDNHEKCKTRMYEIVSEIESIFIGYKKRNEGTAPFYDVDSSGKSIVTRVLFLKKNSGYIEIACYDYSKKIENEYKWVDSLRISVNNSEFQNWLNNEAYD